MLTRVYLGGKILRRSVHQVSSWLRYTCQCIMIEMPHKLGVSYPVNPTVRRPVADLGEKKSPAEGKWFVGGGYVSKALDL
jgi:hypothetical protein